MPKALKVDLTLLKRLVSELDAALSVAEPLKVDGAAEGSNNDYIVEMSKCAGLAASVMGESTMLIGDIQTAIGLAQSPTAKDGPLAKLLGNLKGGGGLPGTN